MDSSSLYDMAKKMQNRKTSLDRLIRWSVPDEKHKPNSTAYCLPPRIQRRSNNCKPERPRGWFQGLPYCRDRKQDWRTTNLAPFPGIVIEKQIHSKVNLSKLEKKNFQIAVKRGSPWVVLFVASGTIGVTAAFLAELDSFSWLKIFS